MKRFIATIILMLISWSISADDIIVENPWVRAAPANAPATAAFMLIKNKGKTDKKLIKATVKNANNYKVIELHRTLKQDGMMKMIKQEFMPINAGDKLLLKPGSWHIMLIKPKVVPKIGDNVKLILEFDDGSKVDVVASVKKMKGKMMKHKIHNDHKNMPNK
jgi:periplasmic copper chaperone A